MTHILGFSGKKQSGKNTSCNYLIGRVLQHIGFCEFIQINEKGKLVISDIYGDTEKWGTFEIENRNPEVQRFLEENVFPAIRLYSFADALKQDVCINVLGLKWEQCYGTEEEKMSPTHLKWQDMPGVICSKQSYADMRKKFPKLCKKFMYHPRGS